jgi:O-antigen/teichoic acid export membrane protein
VNWVHNARWVLGARALGIPIQLATLVLVARWLGTEGFGQYQVVVAWVWLVTLCAQLGHVVAMIVEVRSGGTPVARVAGLAAGITCVMSAVAVVGLWLLGDAVREGLRMGLSDTAYLWLLMTIPFLLSMQLLGGLARAVDRFSLWGSTLVVLPGVRLVGLAGLVLWVEPSIEQAVVVVCVSQAVATLWLSRVLVQTGMSLRLRAVEVSRSLRFGGSAYLYALGGQLHERADLFLLAVWHPDPVQVAVYAAAVQLANRVRMLPLAAISALFPELAEASSEEAIASVTRAVRWILVWVGGAALCVAVLGPVLLPALLGADFSAAVVPLWWLLPATLAYTIHLVLGRYFQARERPMLPAMVQWVGLAVNVGLNAWWIPSAGAVGAAQASGVTYTLIGLWLMRSFVRETGGTWADLMPRPADVQDAMQAALSALGGAWRT